MNEDFFPSSDYKVPSSPSNYFKFEDGENMFRVLSSAIVGWEYWTQGNKPVRSRTMFEETPQDIKLDKDNNPTKIKHFWAFVVWDYKDRRIKILEISQKSIQDGIKALVDNKKWGNPKKYDISVTRQGEGFDTSYTVMPNPHEDVNFEISQAFDSKKINLEALYTGGDPFKLED